MLSIPQGIQICNISYWKQSNFSTIQILLVFEIDQLKMLKPPTLKNCMLKAIKNWLILKFRVENEKIAKNQTWKISSVRQDINL